jgi:predicted ATPase
MGVLTGPILCPTLIGRDAELAALAGSLERARTGDGRTVLIAGEAGIGKTALLRRFAELVRAGGDTYLAGECIEVEARRPFGPFVQVLRAAEQKLPAVVHRTLTGDGRALVRLLPGSQGDEGAAATHSSERYRIHESFVGLFRELARVRPFVVAIDDLQWADEATLELIPSTPSRPRSRSSSAGGSRNASSCARWIGRRPQP